MSVNTFSKRTEIDLRSIQLRSILVSPLKRERLYVTNVRNRVSLATYRNLGNFNKEFIDDMQYFQSIMILRDPCTDMI